MAKCRVCKQEMRTAEGCLASHVHCGGIRYERIKVGSAEDRSSSVDPEQSCPDCNAKPGYYHHWGCDLEICPACGLRLLNCDCEDVLIKGEDVG